MTDLMEVPKAEVIQAEQSSLLTEARSVKVIDVDSHKFGLEVLRRLAIRKKAVEERLDPIAKKLHEAHKEVTNLRADMIRPIAEAASLVSGQINSYEEKERLERERRQREADEAARKAEEERKLAEASAAEKAGDKALAEEIVSEPVDVVAAPVVAQVAKVAGVSGRKSYAAQCIDLLALAKHVVAHPEDIALIEANGPAINARARSQREGFKLAGCKLLTDTVRSFRKVE